jgi:rare lipoprotein A
MRAALIILVLLVFRHLSIAQDSIQRVNKSTGTASFYANKFNGRKTSSGEKFNNDSLTAAHKKLKFGTYVLVRNLKNDSTVVVKINDRLPQKSKRTIDLTTKAAKQLNFIKSGLTKVEITVLDSLKK